MLAVVTKTDLVEPPQVAAALVAAQELGESTGLEFADIVPVSAVSAFQVDLLADLLVARLPEGPPLYPDNELTDEPTETRIAELIREAALEGVRDELPHSLAVSIDETSTDGTTSPSSTRPCTSSGTARSRSCSAPAGPGCVRSAPPRGGRSRRCSAAGSTSTCT